MNVLLNSAAILLAAFGALIVVFNYASIFIGSRNRRRGIDGGISMAPILPQFCVLLAWLATWAAPAGIVPTWLLLGIGLADPSFWALVTLPIHYFVHRRRSNRE